MGSATRAIRRRKIEDWRNVEKRYQKDRNRNLLAKPGVHDFVIVLDQLKAGFNVPKIFRSAQAFGASAIHLVNIDVFDPAPAKGAFRKVPAIFHNSMSDCLATLLDDGYKLFALSAQENSSIVNQTLPVKSAFLFGHEETGFSFDIDQHPDMQILSIPHFGNIESLNVSIAASIVMYEYVRQHSDKS